MTFPMRLTIWQEDVCLSLTPLPTNVKVLHISLATSIIRYPPVTENLLDIIPSPTRGQLGSIRARIMALSPELTEVSIKLSSVSFATWPDIDYALEEGRDSFLDFERALSAWFA